MSERTGALLAVFLSAGAAVAAPPDARAILTRAERVRAAFAEGVVTIRVTLSSGTAGAPAPPPARFEVAVKGKRSRLKFLEPGDEGKYVVMSASDTWLLLPTSKSPIRIPSSQRVRGGLSVSEISSLSFLDDYEGVVEREDRLEERNCAVLRLAARKGAGVSYPVARVWVDEAEGLYRKAVFLLASGRTAKEVTFDAYGTEKGALVLRKMTIVDALRPGTTVVDYLDFAKRSVPDRWLDPATARED